MVLLDCFVMCLKCDHLLGHKVEQFLQHFLQPAALLFNCHILLGWVVIWLKRHIVVLVDLGDLELDGCVRSLYICEDWKQALGA